jgi:hypothetical protein
VVCLAAGAHPRLLVRPDGVPYVVWEGDGLMLARLPSSGAGKPRTIRLAKPEQYGAFPSLARAVDGTLVVAWQQPEEDGSPQIHVARLTRDDW